MEGLGEQGRREVRHTGKERHMGIERDETERRDWQSIWKFRLLYSVFNKIKKAGGKRHGNKERKRLGGVYCNQMINLFLLLNDN